MNYPLAHEMKVAIGGRFGVDYDPRTDERYNASLPLSFYTKSKPFFARVPDYRAEVFDCDNAARMVKHWIDLKGARRGLMFPPAAFIIRYNCRGEGWHRAVVVLVKDEWHLIEWNFVLGWITESPMSDIGTVREVRD